MGDCLVGYWRLAAWKELTEVLAMELRPEGQEDKARKGQRS